MTTGTRTFIKLIIVVLLGVILYSGYKAKNKDLDALECRAGGGTVVKDEYRHGEFRWACIQDGEITREWYKKNGKNVLIWEGR